MAQRNIAALFEDEGRGLALLAFDENGGMLTFTGSGELYLARRIEISLGQLQDADEGLRRQAFDRLELEVQRSLDYFDRQSNHITVKRMLVAVPRAVGLVDVLQENMDVDVERLDLSQVLDLTEAPELASDEAQADAFYALGAALRQERRAL
jgi:MSHA biogenesis protein MshI